MKRSGQRPALLILLDRLGALWLTYVKGQLLLSLIMGSVTWLVGSAIGLTWALALGLIAGILQTIPGLGPIIAAVPAVIVAFWKGSQVIPLDNWAFALIVAGAYLAIQQLSAFFVEPHVLGKRLNLPPLLVLVVVIIGAALGSIVGAYLAVPLVASIREIVRFAGERGGASPTAKEEPDGEAS